MHGYYFNPGSLEKKLASFIGGQFQVKRVKDELIFRGEIHKLSISKTRKMEITFGWLCEKKVSTHYSYKTKWFLRGYPLGRPKLTIDFTCYYSQSDEDRLKVWGGGWEDVCHFFKPDDHTNLVLHEGEYLPYSELHQLNFWRLIFALSNHKQIRNH